MAEQENENNMMQNTTSASNSSTFSDEWKTRVYETFPNYILSTKSVKDSSNIGTYVKTLKKVVEYMFSKGRLSTFDFNTTNITFWEDVRKEWGSSNKKEYSDIDTNGAGHAAISKIIDFINEINKRINQNEDINVYFNDLDRNFRLNSKRNFNLISVNNKPVVPVQLNNNFDSTNGYYLNLIVYGVPGCGKSYYVNEKIIKKDIGIINEDLIIRTTFYQDYSNVDFVGQLLPKVTSGSNVKYEFNPGPFTRALVKAIENPNENVVLVIEEINRGNAPSIFGDIFQLLDRNSDGKSVYKILNVNIMDYLNLYFEKDNLVFDAIKIPANLSIIATMNTSDQNVFTLDTAFKRRWQFEKVKNTFAGNKLKDLFIPGTNVTWKDFVEKINEHMIQDDDIGAEDKQIGSYFVNENYLSDIVNDKQGKDTLFSFKVLSYIWEDIAKFNRDNWFDAKYNTLDKVIDGFSKSGLAVFANGIF